jgi:hypothetical protein
MQGTGEISILLILTSSPYKEKFDDVIIDKNVINYTLIVSAFHSIMENVMDEINYITVISKVLVANSMKMADFWDVTP